MRIVIAAVGRLKDGPERDLLRRYSDRFGQTGRGIGLPRLDIAEVEESRARRPEDRRRDEAAALEAALPPGLRRIALDEHGRTLSSRAFAEDIGRARDGGAPGIAFLIGGADGLDPDLLARLDGKLSFGAMTLPHQLVRVLLCEQLYRAATLLAGHPYHRG